MKAYIYSVYDFNISILFSECMETLTHFFFNCKKYCKFIGEQNMIYVRLPHCGKLILKIKIRYKLSVSTFHNRYIVFLIDKWVQ